MNIRLISQEQEELVLQNTRLVNHLAKKLNIAPSDYEDIISIGTIGLIKAAATYDKEKNVTFATYACRCIENEFKMYFRKAKKYANDISLEEPIGIDNDGNELTLKEIIASPESDFVNEILERENFMRFISIILNVLNPRERLIMLYKLAGLTQHMIAEKLDISQSYISRLEKKTRNKIKSYLKSKQQYKEKIFMKKEDNLYKIYFNSKEIKKFEKIFEKVSNTITGGRNLLQMNEEQIRIVLNANQESFLFIAEFISELDKFNMELLYNQSEG